MVDSVWNAEGGKGCSLFLKSKIAISFIVIFSSLKLCFKQDFGLKCNFNSDKAVSAF